jgi:hypothetical protein
LDAPSQRWFSRGSTRLRDNSAGITLGRWVSVLRRGAPERHDLHRRDRDVLQEEIIVF